MRINDLARELEVKSREILEALPELGIDGKRSHSSSLEEDQIEKVKAYFKGGTSASEPRRDNSRSRVDEEPEEEPAHEAAPPAPAATPVAPVAPAAPHAPAPV